jgi:hypothetical protein
MMNNSKIFHQIMRMINFGDYFTINRPRQYGKTTMLFQLKNHLKETEEYLPIQLNFQGIDEKWSESDSNFAQMFVNDLEDHFRFEDLNIADFITAQKVKVKDMDSLSSFISQLVHKINKKVVLLIDEVDASSNYEPFLSFLGMLRKKFLAREEDKHLTFYSVVLAGVHDIKNLKFKLRNPDDVQYNSPWNIAVDFDVRMSFIPEEIEPMLEQYCEAEGVTMDTTAVAKQLYYHTSGYPFLVSKLCKNIAEKILPKTNKTIWTLDDIDASVQLLLKEDNTNFDSLIKNLENNRDLYDLTHRIVIDGDEIGFNQHNPTIKKGILYGVYKRNGKVKIHNKIYEQLIYNYSASKVETQIQTTNYGGSRQFITEDNGLNFQLVLERFQQFMKEEFSDKDDNFLERQWRLLFLAFIRPIVNGEGYTFKEVQVSEEKRLDVVVTYNQHRYIVELKRWYSNVYHEKGLSQLADYLDIHSLESGFLVIFDNRKKKLWESETIVHDGKTLFVVWV